MQLLACRVWCGDGHAWFPLPHHLAVSLLLPAKVHSYFFFNCYCCFWAITLYLSSLSILQCLKSSCSMSMSMTSTWWDSAFRLSSLMIRAIARLYFLLWSPTLFMTTVSIWLGQLCFWVLPLLLYWKWQVPGRLSSCLPLSPLALAFSNANPGLVLAPNLSACSQKLDYRLYRLQCMPITRYLGQEHSHKQSQRHEL